MASSPPSRKEAPTGLWAHQGAQSTVESVTEERAALCQSDLILTHLLLLEPPVFLLRQRENQFPHQRKRLIRQGLLLHPKAPPCGVRSSHSTLPVFGLLQRIFTSFPQLCEASGSVTLGDTLSSPQQACFQGPRGSRPYLPFPAVPSGIWAL